MPSSLSYQSRAMRTYKIQIRTLFLKMQFSYNMNKEVFKKGSFLHLNSTFVCYTTFGGASDVKNDFDYRG